MQQTLLPLLWRIGRLPTSPSLWSASLPRAPTASFLASPTGLPPNAFLLTVHAWDKHTALVRLAHLFEAGEDPTLSGNVTVALGTLFTGGGGALGGRVQSAVEMTLPGGQPLASVTPVTYRFTTQSEPLGGVSADSEGWWAAAAAAVVNVTLPVVPPAPSGPLLEVTLAPMQIRTFLMTFVPVGEDDRVGVDTGEARVVQ